MLVYVLGVLPNVAAESTYTRLPEALNYYVMKRVGACFRPLVLHLMKVPYNLGVPFNLTFDIARGVLWGHFKLG